MSQQRLERAREELQRAMDDADATVRTQLESLDDGLQEEESSDDTRAEPGSKIDRVAEVMEKLDALEDEVGNREVAEHVGTAHDLLAAYLKNHPGHA